MAREKGIEALTAYKMAKRISNRKDNVYDKEIIENILNMYMDECRQALLQGERIQIKTVGTIIPEVKARITNIGSPVKSAATFPYKVLTVLVA